MPLRRRRRYVPLYHIKPRLTARTTKEGYIFRARARARADECRNTWRTYKTTSRALRNLQCRFYALLHGCRGARRLVKSAPVYRPWCVFFPPVKNISVTYSARYGVLGGRRVVENRPRQRENVRRRPFSRNEIAYVGAVRHPEKKRLDDYGAGMAGGRCCGQQCALHADAGRPASGHGNMARQHYRYGCTRLAVVAANPFWV